MRFLQRLDSKTFLLALSIFVFGILYGGIRSFSYDFLIFISVFVYYSWYLKSGLFPPKLSNKFLIFLILILTLFGIVVLFLLQTSVQKSLLLMTFFLTLAYTLPVKINLRRAPFLKAPIIALGWTLVILAIKDISVSWNTIGVGFSFFFLFLTLAIASDWKDRKKDASDFKTFPQILKFEQFKLFLCVLFILHFIGIHCFIPTLVIGNFLVIIWFIFKIIKFSKNDSNLNFDNVLWLYSLGIVIQSFVGTILPTFLSLWT